MRVSLIIPYYKQIDFLELVLEGLKFQSFKDFEVIIAEDDNSLSSTKLPELRTNNSELKIKHVFHEDIGFRKNKIMNEAIKISEGELIVFIDGDCIPHRHFIKQYLLNAADKTVLLGRRVNMSEKMTSKLLNSKIPKFQNSNINLRILESLNLINLYVTGSERVEEGFYIPFNIFGTKKKRGLAGCNWGIMKKDILGINGFDEDYILAGVGEDSDIDWRLQKYGCIMKSMKHKAIVYHLWHKLNFTQEGIKINMDKMKQKQSAGLFYCKNGIVKK